MMNINNSFFLKRNSKSLSIGIFLTVIYIFTIAKPVNAQWVVTGGPGTGASVRCLAVNGTNIFAGTWGGPNGYPGGAYLSSNNGANWLSVNSGLTDTAVFAFAVIGSNLFAGTYNGGVFRSSNNGANWIPVNTGLTNLTIYSLTAMGANLFAGTAEGVFLSTNNGATWTYKGLTDYLIFAFGVIGTDLFAGTSGDGVYRSSNSGTNWIQVNTGLTNTAVQSLAVSGSNIYAGTFSGVFRSSNNGANWVNTIGLTGVIVNTIAESGGNIFAGSSGGGIFLTTNSGTNWISVGFGMPNTTINTLAVGGTNIFAGALSGNVYRRALSEMTPVSILSGEVPSDFRLDQNYPNPFNPATKIKFALPQSSMAKLVIYDALGREVKTLVNEQLNAGTYEAEFDGMNLASGIYYCRLTAGDFSKVIKLSLIK